MTEQDQNHTRPRNDRGRRIWLALVAAVLGMAAVLGVLGLTGRQLPLPGFLVARIEDRANRAMEGQASVRIGGLVLVVDNNFVPHVALRDVSLYSAKGRPLAVLPEVRARLKGKAALRGRIEAETLSIRGARVALRRLADGSLDLSVGTGGLMPQAAVNPAEVLDRIDAAFAAPALRTIRTISVTGLDLRYDDLRSDQIWRVTDGTLNLAQNERQIGIGIAFRIAEAGLEPARVAVSFLSLKDSPASELYARVTDLNSRDLAAQVPALAWLSALDTRLSGRLRTGVRPDGTLEPLSATLDLGPGALRPSLSARPVGFSAARLDLTYDPALARLDFGEVSVTSPALRVRAGGKAWIKGAEDGIPDGLVGQVRISDLKADPEGLFQDPVSFAQGALDLRLDLHPFRIRIGQFVLVDAGRRISASGDVAVGEKGWSVGLDVAIDAISSDRLLALWPLAAVPKTRTWLADNVASGELFDVKAALRLAPDREPRLSLGYEYRAAEVRFLRTLPPVKDGAGYATIIDNAYTLVVDRGRITAPRGGDVDVTGSVLKVPDIRIKPAPAEITLHSKSSITGALSLLDEPPFRFLTKANRPVDVAEGRAELISVLGLTLQKKVRPEDVSYDVKGRLLDVRSDRVVPGKALAADTLTIEATRDGMSITGPGTLSGVPFDVTWTQLFGPDHRGKSSVEGTVELSPVSAKAFSIGLPEGMIRGKAVGQLKLAIEAGQRTAFRLTSDLTGLRMALPEIGWLKDAGRAGRLEVEGTLGAPAEVTALRLQGAGLDASGDVTLRADGGLERARFGKVTVGDWFDGPVDLVGRGKGRTVGIAVRGGRADLTKADFGKGSGKAGGPLDVRLDRLQVTRGIALTGFEGHFATGGGLNGGFSGDVNGGAPVQGNVAPKDGRSAFVIKAADAGAAMRSAGVFTRGQGGAMDLFIDPDGDAPGHYRGRVAISNLRVVDAPVLAELLGAISVIGLLEQLNGSGILFGQVRGDFRTVPGAIELRHGSAVGTSLGVSAEGVYRTEAGEVDFQGTISPIYLLNGIGQIVSRVGEGLFGFNYRVTGPTSAMRIAVNPLSILTPGMFREIFRSAPPKASP